MNSTLVSLYMGHNPLSNDGVSALIEAVKSNNSLKEINLTKVPVVEALRDQIAGMFLIPRLVLSLSLTLLPSFSLCPITRYANHSVLVHTYIAMSKPSDIMRPSSRLARARMSFDHVTASYKEVFCPQ